MSDTPDNVVLFPLDHARAPYVPPGYRTHFRDADGRDVGVLEIVNGRLVFQGHADLSALVFFDWLCAMWNGPGQPGGGCA